MESDSPSHDFLSARDALTTVADDRRKLAARTRSHSWYAVALAACVGVLVWTHAVPAPWNMTLIVITCVAIVLAESAVRNHTGVSTFRPAGVGGTVILASLIVLILALFLVAALLTTVQLAAWVPLIAITGFILTLSGIVLFDRVNDRELSSGI